MTPVAADLLAAAETDLGHARQIIDIGIWSVAGREGYLAMFHAAQALVFELTGKSPKTHKGVHILFADLARSRASLAGLASRLSTTYELKQDADYSTRPKVDAETCAAALAQAEEFVRAVRRFLDQPREA